MASSGILRIKREKLPAISGTLPLGYTLCKNYPIFLSLFNIIHVLLSILVITTEIIVMFNFFLELFSSHLP